VSDQLHEYLNHEHEQCHVSQHRDAHLRTKNCELVVPNYYGCGSGRGPATGDCASTVIYRWREDKHKFVRTQALRTAGPGQTDHFTVGEDT